MMYGISASKHWFWWTRSNDQVDIVEQGKEQHERVWKWLENSVNMLKVSWKKVSDVQDDCNIQEERLDEANDTHREVRDSAVDESTSTDDEVCHNH